MTEFSNQKKKIINKLVVHIEPDPDDPDIQASNQLNIEIIKEQVTKILDYSGNTNEYPHDGTIVITPRYLKTLPNEVLDLILFYISDEQQSKQSSQKDLYQCSLINKQFYQQTNRLLWHTPVISNTATLDRFLTCLTTAQILQQGTTPSDSVTMKKTQSRHYTVPSTILTAKHHIRQLDIQGQCDWDDIQFSLIMPFLELLETLTIDYGATSKVTDASLQHLPRYCPYITRLAFVPTSSFTQRFIDCVLPTCQHLVQIKLNLPYTNIHPDIFKSILKCPSVTHLVLQINYGNIVFMPNIVHKSFLTTSMVMDMMALNQLNGLALMDPCILSTFQRVLFTMQDDKNNNIIRHPWPLLSSLRIDCDSFLLGDDVMIPLIESLPNLQRLHLGHTSLSDTTLNTIGTHLHGLTHLTLGSNNFITKDGVYNLVRRCHDLKQFDFQYCRQLFNAMVELPWIHKQDGLPRSDMEKIRQHGW